MNLQWLIEFIALDAMHFFGTVVLISSLSIGISQIISSARKNHCELCHRRFADELDKHEEKDE